MVFNYIIEKIAWSANERKLAQYQLIIDKINKLYEQYDNFSKDDIKNKSLELRQRVEKWEKLDDILPEAFALHKQACKKLLWTTYKVKWHEITWNMIPYDVQILGAIILHEWNIAEMKTWEGKTLVATLPIYLNALTWKWVHLVTVNDYLAERDAQTMWILYEILWVSVWFVSKNVPLHQRREQYSKDITYVENSELWFDYLRDNLAKNMNERLLLFRELNYAIVDEADSIMIDEARTPLIISQASAEPTEKYVQYAQIVKALENCPLQTEKKKSILFDDGKKELLDCDYKIDPKSKTAILTSRWIQKLEQMLQVENLYKDLWYEEIHHIENALKAKACYEKDKDYLVYNNEVLIIDENTGRMMPWRRYSEWLHQAIEAKEWVKIQQESETVATITYQNFLKLYKKLSWMTGTASTEWEEFEKIYGVWVVVIPTNKPIIRTDKQDKVFFDQDIKFKNVVETVKFYHNMWVPFLLWTSSVQTSEKLSGYLQKAWLQHSVLNAKYHEMEANIISNAGKNWSVIVATNMAWRWTDIKLEEGIFDKISVNYAKWIKKEILNEKWLKLVVYSKFEFDKLIDALKVEFVLKDDDIIDVIRQEIIKDSFYMKINFNNKKKNKDQFYSQIIIKKSKEQQPEFIEKDIHMWLYVLASEKHESRRIDNQLRWRSWRQWDPGVTQFYVALDDEIMIKSWWLITKTLASKLYSKEELEKIAIENSMITNSIERAQRQMEAMNFSIRKNLFEYDNVLNQQRQFIYSLRDKLIEDKDIQDVIYKYIEDIVKNIVEKYYYDENVLLNYLKEISAIDFSDELKKYKLKDLKDFLVLKFNEIYENKIKEISKEKMKEIQKNIMLNVLDINWMKHIDEMMYLRDKVSMYGYAQIDPLLQYKKEAFEKYQILMWSIKLQVISSLLKITPEQFSLKTQILDIAWKDGMNLIEKLKQAWEIAKWMEVKTTKKKYKWPKILEKNDDFEVIEIDNEEKNVQNDQEVGEIIKKLLGK